MYTWDCQHASLYIDHVSLVHFQISDESLCHPYQNLRDMHFMGSGS